MIKCIAVDDEPLALKLLADNISKVPFLELIGTSRNAFDAMNLLQTNSIDLIFIDIQMPGLTGLQFISTLEKKPLVIFITAYKDYAVESYDLAVVDYLVKPVPLDRFIKACNRAKELFELKTNKIQKEGQRFFDYIFLSADYSQIKIILNDIIWIEGVRDYIKIHLKSKNHPQIYRTSLKAIEPELDPRLFIRIHKSYIVSIESITSVRKSSLFIKEMELPIGETYKQVIETLISKSR